MITQVIESIVNDIKEKSDEKIDIDPDSSIAYMISMDDDSHRAENNHKLINNNKYNN